MFRVLLLVNIVLVAAIVWAHPVKPEPAKNDDPCYNTKKINTEVLNAISVKLM